MFAFKIWGKFGVFRDPLTVTQNLTLPLPPKTTVGGILASILGLDYNTYFNDDEYFNFEYSLVLLKAIRKKSFAQNYVMDYTKRSETKIAKLLKNNEKELVLREQAKPIFRELLLDPTYLIFIDKYKYENDILGLLEAHQSHYPLYMGNSEFAANYESINCNSISVNSTDVIHSFTEQFDKIKFEPGKQYTRLYTATMVVKNREYREYKEFVISNHDIKLNEKIPCTIIETKLGDFNCEFI